MSARIAVAPIFVAALGSGLVPPLVPTPPLAAQAEVLPQEPDAALAALELEMATADDLFPVALRRAHLLVQLGRQAEARRQYEALLDGEEQVERQAVVHFHLGNLAASAGDYDRGIAHLSVAVELAPDLKEAHYNLATLLGKLNRYAEAAVHHGRVVALDESNITSRLGEAVALILSGDHLKALARLEAACGRFPEEEPFYRFMGRLLATSPDADVRNGQRSLEVATYAFSLKPSTEGGETLAMALAELGHFDDAVTLQSEILAKLESQGGLNRLAAVAARERLQLYEQHVACRGACAGW